MKVLITGIAGFIGSQVAKALIERGDEVVGVDAITDYYDTKLKHDRLKRIPQAKFFKANVANMNELCAAFEKKIDVVCHLAAQAGVRHSLTDPFTYEKYNVMGTLNILEIMKKKGLKKIVFASSSSVYGGNTKVPFAEDDNVDKPVSIYAATKRASELVAYTYHHLYNFDCYALRFFTVYGPWGRPDMALFKFTRNMLEGRPIDVYNHGNMKRDFTYITDIVDGIVKSIDKVKGYEILNLGNSDTVELNYFIECIEKALGRKAEKNMLPMQQGDVPVTFADIKKAKDLLGWMPKVKIEEGIKNFIEWYKEYYPNP